MRAFGVNAWHGGLPPHAERRAVAEEEGRLILTIGAEPGTAFEVSAWERRNLTTEP